MLTRDAIVQGNTGHRSLAMRFTHIIGSVWSMCVSTMQSWNYYEGMDDAAVEAELRNDVVWRRKTWPLGTRAAVKRNVL